MFAVKQSKERKSFTKVVIFDRDFHTKLILAIPHYENVVYISILYISVNILFVML